jgi:hypothetical protein
MHRKTLDIEVLDHRKDGGRIVISTGNPDRKKDRVFPQGVKLDNYLKNPVVLWGHDYHSPDALIGRATSIDVTETGIVADFELREPASANDPQHIVRLLWDQQFVRASSIGFMPDASIANDLGGLDFTSWELLEFSLVSVPANAEALRLAAKSYPDAFAAFEKRGRVLSAANEGKIKQAHDNLSAVLDQLANSDTDDGDKAADPLAALTQQVAALHAKLDTLLVQRQPPIDDDAEAKAFLLHLDRISTTLRS